MEWQPIETAPRNGQVILGWRYGIIAIKWTGDENYPWEGVHLSGIVPFMENGFPEDVESLTHWMPLPEAPRTSNAS